MPSKRINQDFLKRCEEQAALHQSIMDLWSQAEKDDVAVLYEETFLPIARRKVSDEYRAGLGTTPLEPKAVFRAGEPQHTVRLHGDYNSEGLPWMKAVLTYGVGVWGMMVGPKSFTIQLMDHARAFLDMAELGIEVRYQAPVGRECPTVWVYTPFDQTWIGIQWEIRARPLTLE